MRSLIVSAFLCVLQVLVLEKAVAADYPITSYLGIEQGLSNNSVRCIYQDHKGLMWFGTYDGLNRYDGYAFKIFRNNFKNRASLINNWINAIDEDAEGNLWVGTRQGVCVYRSLSDSFLPVKYTSLQKMEGAITSVIRDIESDEAGNMFVATADAGLIFVPKGSFAGWQVQFENESDIVKWQDVAAIKRGEGKKIWAFVRGKGLCLYDYRSGKLRLVNSSVTSANCLATNGSLLWVGSSNGVYQYDIPSNTLQKHYNEITGLNHKDIVGLTIDKSGHLWCSTNGGGITVLDIVRGQSNSLAASRESQSLTSNSVYAVLEDQEGRIWIGSLRGGINVIDPHRKLFQTIVSDPAAVNTLISNYIFSFHETPTGEILIGTDGDGLSVWNRRTGRFTNYKHNAADARSLSNNFVTDIKGDDEGKILIATYKGGVNRFNMHAGRFERCKFIDPGADKEITNPLSYTMLQDSRKNYWVTSLPFGLFKLNRRSNIFELFDEKLKDLFVLFEDKTGSMWGGNLSQLIYIDPVSKFHRYFTIGKPVRSIYEDRAGNFWIGTEGAGLILFDRKQSKIIAHYTTDDGLCSNSILNILEDHHGSLWLSTFNGISRYNVKSQTFSNYYQSDGLQSNQFNYNAALKLHTGEMIFGGIKGFTIFDPAHITFHKNSPKICFTGIKIGGKPIEQAHSFVTRFTGNNIEQLEVPFNDAVVSVEFAALEYSAPDKIQYAYYLQGWDRGWNYTNSIRTATYTHLSEGSYTLRVKSTNAEGIWGAKELRLNIVVLPPWYRSWWAYLVYIILITVVVRAFLKYRAKQTHLKYEVAIANLNAENERAEKQRSLAELEKEKAEREKREAELDLERAEREREHTELEMERILHEKEREINEKKIFLFTNISHEFRTPLTLILNPIRDLLKKKELERPQLEGELTVVYRNARRMLSLVDQLLLFRKAESGFDTIHPSLLDICHLAREVYLCFLHQAKVKHINYTIECPGDRVELYADKLKLEIIIYNLLSNAIKYTDDGGFIRLTINDKPDSIVIDVEDSGAGIPKGTGEKLFEKFFQPGRQQTATKPGFGIGLFLAKHFTTQHKGAITYRSEEGKGTLFSLTFLKGKNHFGDQVMIAEGDAVPAFVEELKEDAVTLRAPVLEEAASGPEVVTDKKTLLIVEDDDSIREYLVQLFAQNYMVQQGDKGEKGLELAQQYLPDLIISDIHMEGLNGITLCKLIRANEITSHIPFILLTGSTSDELKLQGIEEGADDYISKPFDSQMLAARVASLLKSRTNLQKYFYNEITLHKTNLKISPEYKKFLERCISVVESHLEDENFTVKTLLAEMGMSHSNLFRKVKSISGLSVNVFIRFIRLRKAAELFVTTDYNVNETAFMVGIKDAKYFREQFNKLFKMNPSEYIKKYRNVYRNQFTVNRDSINPQN